MLVSEVLLSLSLCFSLSRTNTHTHTHTHAHNTHHGIPQKRHEPQKKTCDENSKQSKLAAGTMPASIVPDGLAVMRLKPNLRGKKSEKESTRRLGGNEAEETGCFVVW